MFANPEVNEKMCSALSSRNLDAALNILVESGLPADAEFWDPVTDPDKGESNSLLSFACESKRSDIVQSLLDMGADPNQPGLYGSLLGEACSLGNDEVVRTLVNCGANVTATMSHQEDSKIPVLVAASGRCSPELIQELLDRGADPSARSKKGLTATHHAVEKRDFDTLDILLKAGAKFGGLDLHIPVFNRDLELVRFMIKHGIDVNTPWRYPSPPKGIYQRDYAIHLAVEQLSDDYSVNLKPEQYKYSDEIRQTANQARTSKLEILKLLIDSGADVNAVRKKFGHSPLLQAVRNGDKEIVELLLHSGANPDQELTMDGEVCTPRSVAQNSGDREIFQLIEGTSKHA